MEKRAKTRRTPASLKCTLLGYTTFYPLLVPVLITATHKSLNNAWNQAYMLPLQPNVYLILSKVNIHVGDPLQPPHNHHPL